MAAGFEPCARPARAAGAAVFRWNLAQESLRECARERELANAARATQKERVRKGRFVCDESLKYVLVPLQCLHDSGRYVVTTENPQVYRGRLRCVRLERGSW